MASAACYSAAATGSTKAHGQLEGGLIAGETTGETTLA